MEASVTTTTIRATSSGNFTVPAQMRRFVGIEEGQSLIVRIVAKKIVIEPVDFSYDEEAALKASEKAGDNLRKGNVLEFNSTEEAMDYLEKEVLGELGVTTEEGNTIKSKHTPVSKDS